MINDPRKEHIELPGRVLIGAGQALYGDLWQTQLADLLKMNRRTIQRWAQAGKEDDVYRVAPGVVVEIMRELDRRHMPLERAIEDLRQFYDQAR